MKVMIKVAYPSLVDPMNIAVQSLHMVLKEVALGCL